MELPATRRLAPIEEIAGELGLSPDEIELHGRYAAKIDSSMLARLSDMPDGRLVCVTAITPTTAGEGKTTTAISLADALAANGHLASLCLREPSLGPVFGIKGGGTGGGHAQVAPMELVNLHFTGDIHAVGAANNLLAAMVDSHIWHGNELGIDPAAITWRRCVDMDDRSLRQVVTGLSDETPRETGFDITAASEVMAILSMARDITELRRRLGAITIGQTNDGGPVTAEMLGAAGAMTALLTDALKPNLVQTLERTPAFVHAGPFANIAHGNNSLLADRLALKLSDYVVTESGFGSDMGFEKLVDIVLRSGGIAPQAVVLVATTKALKRHGGDEQGGLEALERGADNLGAHLKLIRELGFYAVVAVNRFPGDSHEELGAVQRLALERGAFAAEINDGYSRGGEGAIELAEAVEEAANRGRGGVARPLYSLDEPIADKIEAIAKRAYGAAGIELSPEATEQAERLEQAGLGALPVCMAKTHLSLSHDPSLPGAPVGYTLPVRELRAYTGAGWIVALCGEIMTMPGLPARPAAERIDVDGFGTIEGLR